MDAKVTLRFDAKIIKHAKQYAESQGISLSRLTEILLRKLTRGGYRNIENFPVDGWVAWFRRVRPNTLPYPKAVKN